MNYCSWVNWPQHPFIPNIHQKSKKMWFANVSVVINSFFLDYGHVSHLIFTSSYVRDTHCSHNLNFAIFFYRQIRKINVSRKFSCNKDKVLRFFIKFLSIFFSLFFCRKSHKVTCFCVKCHDYFDLKIKDMSLILIS